MCYLHNPNGLAFEEWFVWALSLTPVLNLLSRERGVYGLRNGDHERYRYVSGLGVVLGVADELRRHCANKVHRLRQVTGQTSGKGKVYKKPAEVTAESVVDAR